MYDPCHHQSSFVMLSGSATWILALCAMWIFQRPSILISRSMWSSLAVLIEVFKVLPFRLHHAPTYIFTHLLIGAVKIYDHYMSWIFIRSSAYNQIGFE